MEVVNVCDAEVEIESPIRKFKEARLAKVKVPYIVTPVKESQFVEGYRVSSGLVIETCLYDKYKKRRQ